MHHLIYSQESVTLNRKLAVVVTAGALIFCFGCSGINASHSVSPIDFLLPGMGGFGSLPPESCPAAPCETNGVPATPAFAALN